MKSALLLLPLAASHDLSGWGNLLDDEAFLSKPVTNGKPWVGATMRDFKHLLGAWNATDRGTYPKHKRIAAVDIPDEFDWRTDSRAANCPSVSEIRDQGNCGSCWAFASTEAINDRLCIETGSQVHLSVEDVLSCCGDSCGNGCNGGLIDKAHDYISQIGSVDGGNYGDKSGCLSYQLRPCAHHTNSSEHPACSKWFIPDTPRCPLECIDNGADWDSSKVRAGTPYAVCDTDDGIKVCIEKMMQDIYQNGPITAAFQVFPSFESFDFSTDKVYKPEIGELIAVGAHAIKMIGYGTQDGEKYWLIANSWNTDWGYKGFFKMKRGADIGFLENPYVNGAPIAGDFKNSVVV